GQHQRGEVVVEHGGVDVGRAEPALRVHLTADQAHLRDAGDLGAVVAGHHVLVVAGTLGGGEDQRGRVRQVAGPFGGDDDQRLPAVALLAAVEQAQRLGDPAGGLVVGEGDGPPVEPGGGVGGGVLAVDDGDAA